MRDFLFCLSALIVVLCFALIVFKHQRDKARDACRAAIDQWHDLLAVAAGQDSADASELFTDVKNLRFQFFAEARRHVNAPVVDVAKAAMTLGTAQEARAAIRLIEEGIVTRQVYESSGVNQAAAGGRSSDSQRSGYEEQWRTEVDDTAAKDLLRDLKLFKDRVRAAVGAG